MKTTGVRRKNLRRARPGLVAASSWIAGCLTFVAGYAGAATLQVNPDFVYLGSFSTLDAIQSVLPSGSTTLTVLCEQDWRLELTLTGAIRQPGGSITLPPERALETHPYVPVELISLGPAVIASGPGSVDTQEFERDWLELQSALQEYLMPGDPPGTYEAYLVGRLLAASGQPLTEFVSLTVQFDIEPWIEIVLPVPVFTLSVLDGSGEGTSDIETVTLRSNTAWELAVAGEGRLLHENGSTELGFETLTACVPGDDAGGDSDMVSSGCATLSTQPVVLASGTAPAPFSLATVEVPIEFLFRGEAIPVGTYDASILFSARSARVARPLR